MDIIQRLFNEERSCYVLKMLPVVESVVQVCNNGEWQQMIDSLPWPDFSDLQQQE